MQTVRSSKWGAGLATVWLAALCLWLGGASAAQAGDRAPLAEELTTSTKTAANSNVVAGGTVAYTVALNNTGTDPVIVAITDTLPVELTLLTVSVSSGTVYNTGNTITGTLAINANATVTVQYTAEVDGTAAVGTLITNTVHIVGGVTDITRSATVEVVEPTTDSTIYLPLINTAPPIVNVPTLFLTSSRPNSGNSWTLSWTGGIGGLAYELQESQTADFAAVTTINAGGNTNQNRQLPASFHNVFFYRVRGVAGNNIGEWSNVVRVVGAYEDDFTDNASGWKLRRTTFIEKVSTYYENAQNGYNDRSLLVIKSEDSWDWGISSPLMPAPEPPYVIEYRMRVANLGNLVSSGPVWGGDWNGVPEPASCINYSTPETVYAHTDCFNHFYFINTIWYGSLVMQTLFERVDTLIWCPSCGGSPMKRLGDIDPDHARELTNVNPDAFNVYRIEVRENEMRFYANGTYQYSYNDTRYITSPYFGVAASTDEYSNSTWVFDYFKVMPLDD